MCYYTHHTYQCGHELDNNRVFRRSCLKNKLHLKCKDIVWEKIMGNLCETCHEEKKLDESESETVVGLTGYGDDKIPNVGIYECMRGRSPGARSGYVSGEGEMF